MTIENMISVTTHKINFLCLVSNQKKNLSDLARLSIDIVSNVEKILS